MQSDEKMRNWFENKLFPMMLECENNVRSSMGLEINQNNQPHCGKFVSDSLSSYSRHSNAEEYREEKVNVEKLADFLQKSAAHQHHMEEVRRQRERDEAQYIPDTHGPVEISPPSDSAPNKRPDKCRYDALVSLYGRKADTIVSMETALQTRFDQISDATQPRYWPIIPFKF